MHLAEVGAERSRVACQALGCCRCTWGVRAAMALAMARVPCAKRSHSKTPMGPFHSTQRQPCTAALKAHTLSGPMSRPCRDGMHALELKSTGMKAGGNDGCSKQLKSCNAKHLDGDAHDTAKRL